MRTTAARILGLSILACIVALAGCEEPVRPEAVVAELNASATAYITRPGPALPYGLRIRFHGTAPGVTRLIYQEIGEGRGRGYVVSEDEIPLSQDSTRSFDYWLNGPRWPLLVLRGFDGTEIVASRSFYAVDYYVPNLSISPSPGGRFVPAGTSRIDLHLTTSAFLEGDAIARVEGRVGEGEPVVLQPRRADPGNYAWSPELPDEVTWLSIRSETEFGNTLVQSFPVVHTRNPEEPGDYIDLATSRGFSCGLIEAGDLRCWGSHRFWDAADPEGFSTRPRAAHSGWRFSRIFGGPSAMCGLDASAAAFCWGGNDSGVLGDGTTDDRDVPTPVAGDLTFMTFALGYKRTCGIATDGAAWCWGENSARHLDPDSPHSTVPVEVPGGIEFSEIAVTVKFVCGISNARELFCWDGVDVLSPKRVEPEIALSNLAGSGFRICTVDGAGDPWCWRWAMDQFPSLTRFAVGLNLRKLTAGTRSICGISEEDAVQCWDDHWESEPVEVPVPAGVRLVALDAADHVCGLAANGAAYCWGRGSVGELGNLTRYDVDTPVRVADPRP